MYTGGMAAQFRFDINVNVKQTDDGLYIATNACKLFMLFVTSRDRVQLDGMIHDSLVQMQGVFGEMPEEELVALLERSGVDYVRDEIPRAAPTRMRMPMVVGG